MASPPSTKSVSKESGETDPVKLGLFGSIKAFSGLIRTNQPAPHSCTDRQEKLPLKGAFWLDWHRWNTATRVLFRKRELTEFLIKLGEFGEELGELALTYK